MNTRRAVSRLAALLTACALVGISRGASHAQADMAPDEEAFLQNVSRHLEAGEFAELEALAEQLRREKPRFPSGRSKLRTFYQGLGGIRAERDPTSDPYRDRLDRLDDWIQARPESVAARLAAANCWLRYGWYQQGGVSLYRPLVGQPDFDDQTRAVERLLDEIEHQIKVRPIPDPEFDRIRVELAIRNGSGRERLLEILKESAKLDPGYDSTFAVAVMRPLSLRIASPIEPAELADTASEMTQEARGQELYAVVVFETWPYFGSRLFHKYDFSWERTRQGFRERLKRFPDSLEILNKFCLLATYAGDRRTAHEIFEKIGDRWDRALWQAESNHAKRRAWARPNLLQGDQRLVFPNHADSLLSVAYSPDGRWVATGGADRRIIIRDAQTGEEDHHLDTEHRTGIAGLAYSPDGQWLASSGDDAAIRLWSPGKSEPIVLGLHQGGARHLAFSPDGLYLATAGLDGRVLLWDMEQRARVDPFQARANQRVTRVAFRPDSRQVAAVDLGGRLKIWDVPSGESRLDLKAHDYWSAALAYAPDGQRLATGGADGLVKIWDLDKKKPIARFRETGLQVMDLAFSPDGSRLAAVTSSTSEAGKRGELLIWDVAAGQLLKKYRGHKSGIWAVAIAPDGKSLATAGNDMTLRIWEMP